MTKCLSFACGRQVAVTLCVAAALLLSACGGGNAGARASLSGSNSPVSEGQQSGSGSDSTDTAGSDSAQAQDDATDTGETRQPTPGSDDDTASNDDTTSGDGGTSNDDTASSDDTGSSDGTASNTDDSTTDDSQVDEELVSKVSGSVTLEWQRPQERENGDYLEGDEIGGYELRYKRPTDSDYEVVILDDGWADEYQLDYLEGDYQFSIAAYDSNGLYSNFVSLSPVTN